MKTDYIDSKQRAIQQISKVYVTDRFILVFGENLNTEYHSHHALQLVLSLEDQMRVKCDDHLHAGDLIIINSNHKHAIVQSGVSVLLLIDSEHLEAEEIRCSLDLTDCYTKVLAENNLKEMAQTLLNNNMDKNFVFDFFYSMIRTISTSEHNHNHNVDKRIEAAISIIKDDVTKSYSPEVLANEVYLSLSRFQHLFKEETGNTLSRFLLWQRTLKAFLLIVKGRSFTDAAIKAGFSDGAHFSRIVKRNFGLTMTDILKNKKFEVIIFE